MTSAVNVVSFFWTFQVDMELGVGVLLTLVLTSGQLLGEVRPQDICFQYFKGKLMTCQGSLPLFYEDYLTQIHQVQDLHLQSCNFTQVPKDTFRGLHTLRSLTINCDRRVTNMTLDRDSLRTLTNLDLLSLNYDGIRALPAGLLCELSELRLMYLTGNSLTSLDDLGFGQNCDGSSSRDVSCDGRWISTLVLRNNSIVTLPSNALCALTNLTKLDLSGNGLTTVHEGALSALTLLKELDLSANNFSSLPARTFSNATSLLELNLSENLKLTNWDNVLQSLPANLKMLNLTNVGLDTLEDFYFANLTQLTSLVLDGNRLQHINESALLPLVGEGEMMIMFDDMLLCRMMYDGSKLTDGSWDGLFDDILNRPPGLRFFSLNSNNLTAVPRLGVLVNLQAVSLDHNSIDVLQDDDFAQLTLLQSLHLSHNRIAAVGPGVFRNLSCLMELHLDHNSISDLSPAAFDHNSHLILLNLQFNKIRSVQGMFLANHNLMLLNLSHNLLETVSIDAFPLQLVQLDLSANLLTVIGQPGRVPLHLGMDLLDLSGNRLTSITKAMFPISLRQLLLHGNRIASMADCTLCSVGRLELITLHDNLLTTLRFNWLKRYYAGAPKVTSLTLRGNPFVCDCRMEFFGLSIGVDLNLEDYDQWRCRREYTLGKEPFLKVSKAQVPEDFLCSADHSTNASLDRECTIYHNLAWNYVIADCSDRNLTSIPQSLTKNVVKLHFDGNRLGHVANETFRFLTPKVLKYLYLNACVIEEVDDYAFEALTELAVLHLEDNRLRHLGPAAFEGLHRLLELYLSSNHLKIVDDRTFLPLVSVKNLSLNHNYLTSFPVWRPLRRLERLVDVRLSDNPWSCDCDFVDPYRKWLLEFSAKVTDVDDLFCKYDDNSTSEVPLISFDEAACYSGLRAVGFLQSRYFTLTISICSLVVFAVILGALLFLYRKEMQVLIYSRYGVRVFAKAPPADENDVDRVFDAFVSYSHDDEDFVMEQLVPKLENIKAPFRLCLHHRDFQVGVFITVNIFDAIAKSRRSILVLSDNFMRSEWCRFEFKQAHLEMFRDSSHRVILIVLGDIPENLDPEMENYMKTNTYLKWGDRLFFERLYFTMPDRKTAPTSTTPATPEAIPNVPTIS